MVTLNGRFLGFYVVREAFEKRFLRRVFHSSTGNLYEGNCCTDFAPPFGNPSMLDLKNEEEEQRTREDLERFAHLLVYTPDAQLEDALDEVLDVDRFLTYYALEAALAHWDGFSFNLNNYYLYDDPLDGRFVFLPHGMDQLLDRPTMDPWMMPKSLLTGRIRRHPRLDLRFREHLIDVVARVWNEGDLLFRADEVRRIVRSAPHVDPAVPRAIDAFDPAFQTQRARYRARLDLLRDRVTR